jgi:hypothetical protein
MQTRLLPRFARQIQAGQIAAKQANDRCISKPKSLLFFSNNSDSYSRKMAFSPSAAPDQGPKNAKIAVFFPVT